MKTSKRNSLSYREWQYILTLDHAIFSPPTNTLLDFSVVQGHERKWEVGVIIPFWSNFAQILFHNLNSIPIFVLVVLNKIQSKIRRISTPILPPHFLPSPPRYRYCLKRCLCPEYFFFILCPTINWQVDNNCNQWCQKWIKLRYTLHHLRRQQVELFVKGDNRQVI